MDKKILLRVQYEFDGQKAWRDSYLKNIVKKIDTTLNIHESIKNIIEDIDYWVTFTKQKPEPMFCDDAKTGESIQTWFVYRIIDEIEGKKYRGNCWVTMYEVNDFIF